MKENAFTISASINVFDEPKVPKKLEARLKLNNVIVELCPEILKSLTQLIPEFKAVFRFKDLYKNKSNNARLIELITPLYVFRERHFITARDVDEEQVLRTFYDLVSKRKSNISAEEIQKMKNYKDVSTMRALKGLDKTLRNVDWDIYYDTVNVSVNITGNQYHTDISNKRVVEVGFKNQVIRITKLGTTLQINFCGVVLTTFFQFLEIYKFFKMYTNSIKAYVDNYMMQTSEHHYEEFIKDLEAVMRVNASELAGSDAGNDGQNTQGEEAKSN